MGISNRRGPSPRRWRPGLRADCRFQERALGSLQAAAGLELASYPASAQGSRLYTGLRWISHQTVQASLQCSGQLVASQSRLNPRLGWHRGSRAVEFLSAATTLSRGARAMLAHEQYPKSNRLGLAYLFHHLGPLDGSIYRSLDTLQGSA